MNEKMIDVKQQWLKNLDSFDIVVCESKPNFEDEQKFIRLDCGSAAKMQVSAFVHELPAVMAVGAIGDVYIAKFPDGVPHVLSKLNNGGYFNMLRSDDGIFTGVAPLYRVGDMAVVAGIFTAMSVVTSQYYLSEINSKLNKIQQGVDKILDFLYGDKRAELLSEIYFVRNAHENYISIMAHESQKIATISGLQGSKKTAIKDIEFFVSDLEKIASEKVGMNVIDYADRALRIKESLDLSMQLYALSGLLEMFYSQNYDENYISNLDKEMTNYLDRTEKQTLRLLGIIRDKLNAKKDEKLSEKKGVISRFIDELESGEDSKIQKALKLGLHASEKRAEYYITGDGDLYLKKA